MNEIRPDKLIAACQQDTAILTSTNRWLDAEIEKVATASLSQDKKKEIYRLQGEARALRKLKDSLSKAVRVKEDGEADEPKVRRVG